MIKKSLVVVLSMILVLAMAGTAVAAPPASWNPPGPTYRTDTAAWPSEKPHEQYVATGDKCEICHSPHQAGDGSGASWKLLHNTTRDAACDYCHVGASAKTTKVVYTEGGVIVRTGKNGHEITAFSGGIPDATTGTGAPNIGAELDCLDCHSPHGAKALATDILRKDPGNNGGADATDETTFCADCHNRNYNKVDNYSLYDHLGESHPLSTAGPHSSAGSRYCDTCHSASRGGLYPHISSGDALLANGAKREQMDRSCYGGCHGLTGVEY